MEDNRIKRLRQWIGEYNGSIADFCRAYSLPPSKASYLSQVLGGHRPLGERAARTLEAECGRPSKWLDIDDSETKGLRYDVHRCNQLGKDDRDLIEGFIEFVLKRSEKRADGNRLNIEERLEPLAPAKGSQRKTVSRKSSGHSSLNLQTRAARKSKRAA
jgi:hypothetical protein